MKNSRLAKAFVALVLTAAAFGGAASAVAVAHGDNTTVQAGSPRWK